MQILPSWFSGKWLVIYLKGNYLEPQTALYKWWAIKWMISNLYIGTGCFTISIHFKNRLFGLPGTFLGRYTHASLHHVYGRKGFRRVSPLDSRRLQPVNRFPVVKSRHTIFLGLLLQMLKKKIFRTGDWWCSYLEPFDDPCFAWSLGLVFGGQTAPKIEDNSRFQVPNHTHKQQANTSKLGGGFLANPAPQILKKNQPKNKPFFNHHQVCRCESSI